MSSGIIVDTSDTNRTPSSTDCCRNRVVSWQPRVSLLAVTVGPLWSITYSPIKRRRAAEWRDIIAALWRRFNKLHHLQPVDCRCTPGSAQSLRTLDTRVWGSLYLYNATIDCCFCCCSLAEQRYWTIIWWQWRRRRRRGWWQFTSVGTKVTWIKTTTTLGLPSFFSDVGYHP